MFQDNELKAPNQKWFSRTAEKTFTIFACHSKFLKPLFIQNAVATPMRLYVSNV